MLVLIGCDAQEPLSHAAVRAILPMSVLLKNLRTGGGSRPPGASGDLLELAGQAAADPRGPAASE